MLEVFINFICAFMMVIIGYVIIVNIINSNVKINPKIIIIMIINSILVVLIHAIKYNSFTSLLVFLINVITYKLIFNKNYSDTFIFTGLLTILMTISELLWVLIIVNFLTMDEINNNIYLYLVTNIIIALTMISCSKIKKVNLVTIKIYESLKMKGKVINIIFIILFTIGVSSLMYNIFFNFETNIFFFSNVIITSVAGLITIIYFCSKEKYYDLSTKYDELLDHVQNFEKWIEQEQYLRHEYKNQLAIIYALSNQIEVKNKIQDIINQNLNIENEEVKSLKPLPKGGLKGLMYYKTIIAQNNKINLTIDVCIKEKGILFKMNKKEINQLAKLIGIFYDNAIEAAKESRKKIILIEIYELNDKVNFVISNTFKKSNLVDKRNEKGVSSKGKGHGYGLYYANKITKELQRITTTQEIIDNYYVETISISKNTSKKRNTSKNIKQQHS